MTEPKILPIEESRVPGPVGGMIREVRDRLGRVPNLFRVMAHSPAALESGLSQLSAAERMSLPPRTQEAIALRAAELFECTYCMAAHSQRAEAVGIDRETARRYRNGGSLDPKEQALLALATKLIKDRGHHTGFVIDTAREVGATDGEMVEVVSLVAYHTFLNSLASMAGPEVDSKEF